jgi:hypothetical protein
MGSPAVSCSSRISIASITSGVFFNRFAPAAGLSNPADLDILIQQLAAAAGDGVRIEAQKFGQHGVAAMAEFHGFQTSVQAALPFVQQTVEQNDGTFHFVGRYFHAGRIDHDGNGLVATTCQRLPLAGGGIDGGIEEQAGDQLPGDPLLLHKLTQNILRAHVQDRRQFFRKISRDRATDEHLGGGQQGTVTREPGWRAGPQAIGSEAGNLAKRVETAPMRVAGQVVEFFELSEDGEVDVGAEGTLQIGKRDLVMEQQLSQGIRREGERSHNVIVTTERALQSTL